MAKLVNEQKQKLYYAMFPDEKKKDETPIDEAPVKDADLNKIDINDPEKIKEYMDAIYEPAPKTIVIPISKMTVPQWVFSFMSFKKHEMEELNRNAKMDFAVSRSLALNIEAIYYMLKEKSGVDPTEMAKLVNEQLTSCIRTLFSMILLAVHQSLHHKSKNIFKSRSTWATFSML